MYSTQDQEITYNHLPILLHHLAEFCLRINVTCAGKRSRNAHGLISSYKQKKLKMLILVEFEVFTNSSLSPLLAIPMLHIVFKKSKYIFICMFYERSTFSSLTSRADCHNGAYDGVRS